MKREREIIFITKRKEKRIMASEFLTLVGRFCVSDFIPNHQLF